MQLVTTLYYNNSALCLLLVKILYYYNSTVCLQLILVLKSVDKYEITNTSVMIQIISHVLAYMNSCVNPILYAFLSDHFRKAFRKVINCGNAHNVQTGPRYHQASTLQAQANGRGPSNECCDNDNKSMLLKTTRLNGSTVL
jgi:hypothetical protein